MKCPKCNSECVRTRVKLKPAHVCIRCGHKWEGENGERES